MSLSTHSQFRDKVKNTVLYADKLVFVTVRGTYLHKPIGELAHVLLSFK